MNKENQNYVLTQNQIDSVLSLYSKGKIHDAINLIKALNKDFPNVPLLFNLLGACYQALDQDEPAIQMFRTAIMIKEDYAEAHFNLGVLQRKVGDIDNSILSYKKAISLIPTYAQAHNNLGNVLFQINNYHESIKCYRSAVELIPEYAEAHYNLAGVYKTLGNNDDAEKHYKKSIEIKPNYAEAYNNLGVILKKIKRLDEALECFEKAEKINPDLEFILGPLLKIKKDLCFWENLSERILGLSSDIKNKKRSVAPFFLLGLIDDPELQMKNTEIYVNKKHSHKPKLSKIARVNSHNKIRLAYFSADFHNHATMHLMAELFEKHDKNFFEVIAFSFGPDKKDDYWRKRILPSFNQFIDVGLKSDEGIAKLARDMKIDIAIDLKGYTKDSRPNIFLERCAPVQINFLGYPGTMMAEFMDYLIADEIIIPKEKQKYYSEKIVYMPNTYQPNISERDIPVKKITRKELGLPENSFVFCSFNNAYKISPIVFRTWINILLNVKNSVLWLYVNNQEAVKNLKREAARLGVQKNKLYFSSHVNEKDHLNRLRCADLFLDSLPYNAHTTASEALRMGLPVLTLAGNSFAARVAASILNAINLPELIVNSQEEYESKAIELATNSKKYKLIKDKLSKNLSETPLFDSTLFTKHLEKAYIEIYDKYQKGMKPDHIYVNNLK